MSDNPDEIRVGIEADDAGFTDLNAQIDAIADHFSQSSARSQASIGALANKFDALLGNVRTARSDAVQIVEAYQGMNQAVPAVDKLDASVVQLSKDTKAATEEAERLALANDLAGGAEKIKTPTLYGAGRAFSAGGELARNAGGAGTGDALAGIGQLIRFEEGLQQLGPYLAAVNEGVEQSTVLIPKMSSALFGAGTSFGSLAVVIAPLAIAVGYIAWQFIQFKESLKPLTEALNEGIQRNTAYYKAIESGKTQTEVQSDIEESTRNLTASQSALKDQQDALNSSFKQTKENQLVQAAGNVAGLIPGLSGQGEAVKDVIARGVFAATGALGIDPLQKSVKELGDTALKSAADVKANSDAINSANIINNTIQKQIRDDLDARIEREGRYIQYASLSMKAAEDQIGVLITDKSAREAAIAELERQNQTLDKGSTAYQANQDAIDKHQAAIDKDTQAIEDISKAEEDIIGPREREAEAIRMQNEAIQRKIGFMGRETDLTENGTPDQLENFKRSLRNQLAGQQFELGELQTRGNPEDKQRIDSLKASIKDTVDELARLELVIGPIVETNKALKDMAKAAEDFNKAEDQITTNLATQKANAIAREKEAEKQYMTGSLQDIEARYQIALKADRAETELAQRTSDAIIDILTKREQKISDINLDFARQIEDDTIKARDEASKIQQDAQRAQRDDLADHLNRIAEINRNAFADEKQALYDRNFLQFAKLELQRQTDLADEDSKFQQKRDKVAERLKQDEEELVQSLENQAEQRQRDYERKLADADTAAQREIAQQNTNEQRKLAALRQAEQDQLNDLVHSQRYKLQVLQQGLQQELQLYAAQAAARIRLAAQERDALTAQSQNALDIINAFTQSQRNSNTNQSVYPWQTSPQYNSTTNNTFNPTFNNQQASSRQYSDQEVSHEFERFASGIFR